MRSLWIIVVAVVLSACGNSAPIAAPQQIPAVTVTAEPTATAEPTPEPTLEATGISLPMVSVSPSEPEPISSYRVIESYPHDHQAFTQGLVFEDGIFYEGTGLNGQSSLRKVNPITGEVLQRIDLDQQYFGEGITIFNEKIYQITWQSQVGFIYNKDFELLGEFQYPGEGWGLTHDGERLIMSDGTPIIRFLDPETLDEIGNILVNDSNGPVLRLNELEYVNGEIWANIWLTDRIARIDPASGKVLSWIDLSGLLSEEDRAGLNTDVLNGIAYDSASDRLYVTGKLWPKLYEIEIVP